MNSKIISFINLKGGVGKTTLAVTFAEYCARAGHKTLLIDVDPQTNASIWTMGFSAWEKHATSKGTVADLFGLTEHKKAEGSKKEPSDITASIENFNFQIIPSHLDLFTIDFDLASATLKELKLKKSLNEYVQSFDYVIFDCPPNLTIPTQNALAFSTHYVIPTSSDYLSALGIGLLINRVTKLGDELDNKPTLAGIVLSKAGNRPTTIRDNIENDLRKHKTFGKHVINGKITDRVAVVEATQNRSSIFDSRNQDSIDEFSSICSKLLNRIG